MNTVPAHIIEEIWDRQCGLDLEASRLLMGRFTQEQPFLASYLVACEESLGEEDPDNPFIPLSTLVWETLLTERGVLNVVKLRAIRRAEAHNLRFLKSMETESEIRTQAAVVQMMATYPQRTLLEFAVKALMAGHEEAPELAPENIGMALVYIKTIIDCLDQ